MSYNKLGLSGGGVKGLAQLGALHYFYESGNLSNLKEVSGTSIGSVIGLLLVCGYSPIEIFSEVYMTNYLLKPKPQDFLQIFAKMGLMDIRAFTGRVRDMVGERIGVDNITFEELFKMTNKKLIAGVSDITSMDTVYMSHESHPDVSCLDAIEFSCNLPVIFQRLQYQDHYMADGAITNNFPIEPLSVSTTDRVLGIIVSGKDTSFEASNPAGYLYRMIQMSINTQTTLRVKRVQNEPNFTLININCPSSSIFNIKMTSDDKMSLFKRGYDYAKFNVSFTDIVIPRVNPFDGWDDWGDQEEFESTNLSLFL